MCMHYIVGLMEKQHMQRAYTKENTSLRLYRHINTSCLAGNREAHFVNRSDALLRVLRVPCCEACAFNYRINNVRTEDRSVAISVVTAASASSQNIHMFMHTARHAIELKFMERSLMMHCTPTPTHSASISASFVFACDVRPDWLVCFIR